MKLVCRLVGFASLTFLVSGGSALAQMEPMHDWGYGFGWPMGVFIGPVFLLLIIIGFVTVVRWLFGSRSSGSETTSAALNILAERYARGEINREEYEQHRRDLQS